MPFGKRRIMQDTMPDIEYECGQCGAPVKIAGNPQLLIQSCKQLYGIGIIPCEKCYLNGVTQEKVNAYLRLKHEKEAHERIREDGYHQGYPKGRAREIQVTRRKEKREEED